MRLLLDSHVLIAITQGEPTDVSRGVAGWTWSPDDLLFASAASFWEIAIKARLGKLDPGLPDLPHYFLRISFNLLPVDHVHAVQPLDPEPPTRDPFDRLLLAQCAVENLRLVTLDRSLVDHPLVWRPA